MSFWWLNNNQTHEASIMGGCIWSPMKKADGSYNQSYQNMLLTREDDIVFSYHDQHIYEIGVIQERAYSARKPDNYPWAVGQQSKLGWCLRVNWYGLPIPLDPKSYIHEIRSLLPSTYSPLNRKTGGAAPGAYLAAVPPELAEYLTKQFTKDVQRVIEINQSPKLRQFELERVAAESVHPYYESDLSLGKTESEALGKQRLKQSQFRKNLERVEKGCRISGITDGRFLISSHMKRWAVCDDRERVDGNNGLLFCPNIDWLFERGFISFADDGLLLISTQIDPATLAAMGVPMEEDFRTDPFNNRQKYYLAWHRENAFKP